MKRFLFPLLIAIFLCSLIMSAFADKTVTITMSDANYERATNAFMKECPDANLDGVPDFMPRNYILKSIKDYIRNKVRMWETVPAIKPDIPDDFIMVE